MPHRGVEVDGRVEAQEVEAQKESTQVTFTFVAASARDHLHDHGLGHGNSVALGDELGEALIDRAPRWLGRTPPTPRCRRGSPRRRSGGTSVGIWSIACRAAHRQRLVTGHWLTGEMSKCEVDRLGLGVYAEAVHDRLDVGVLELDVRANPAHTPMVHVTCTIGVERSRGTLASGRGGREGEPRMHDSPGPSFYLYRTRWYTLE